MDDTDKIFNYQLTIQKLEEECNLYRNGTTGVELLELIAEKDAELKEVHKELDEKNILVQKLVKSSSEVLEKCQLLQADNIALTTSKNILEKTVAQHETTLRSNQSQMESQLAQIESLRADVERYSVEINERFDDISRLQTRCATLVSEKSEKSRNLEDLTASSAKKAKKMEDEIAKLKSSLESVNSALAGSQTSNKALTIQNNRLIDDFQALQVQTDADREEKGDIIRKLTDENASLSTQLGSVQRELFTSSQNVSSLTMQTSQISQTMEGLLAKKEDEIKQLRESLAHMEYLLSSRSSTITTTSNIRTSSVSTAIPNNPLAGDNLMPMPPAQSSQQSHRHQQQANSNKYPSRSQSQQQSRGGVSSAATSSINTASSRSSHAHGAGNNAVTAGSGADASVVTADKNSKYVAETLEGKIKRQEDYLRQRFLKDKTNTTHAQR